MTNLEMPANPSTAIRCVVDPPHVTGDRVHFSWQCDVPIPQQRQQAFTFAYPGLDLQVFSSRLWLEIFLALQIRVFAHLRKPVSVYLPEAMPAPVVAFWLAYHRATLVEVGPTDGAPGYEPLVVSHVAADVPRQHALFLGGGKDSLVAALLLRELDGPDDLLLINYAAPAPGHTDPAALAIRNEALLLEPARRRLGVATRAVVTDYQENLAPGPHAPIPHVEFYAAGALPWLIHENVQHAFLLQLPY